MTIEVLNPHGFCAGVTAAIAKAAALSNVYCLHELVHNELVVSELRARGFKFVERVCDVPEGATILFSAHGVAPAVREEAAARHLTVVDATCHFVARVHRAARTLAVRGIPVVIIGHPNHVEVQGICGEVDKFYIYPDLPTNVRKIGVVSQTTLNSDEVAQIVAKLKTQFDEVETMAEVCHATKVRQDAVRHFRGDALLVLGSSNSSNTRRLCEIATCKTFRAGTLDDVKALDLQGVEHLGVTSGASTPEEFFNAALCELEKRM